MVSVSVSAVNADTDFCVLLIILSLVKSAAEANGFKALVE